MIARSRYTTPIIHWALALPLVFLLLTDSACTFTPYDTESRFTLLPPDETGIAFTNRIDDEPDFNILEYLYFYDGGGVAIGDVTNDGLLDIFFTGNQVANRLYINQGDFRFDDGTDRAGISHNENAWSTGVTMADVNADGWLDIYVCQVSYKSKTGRNLLYINNQDPGSGPGQAPTFTEQAADYGLDFDGLSTQAAFFDYDRDGDLDLYLLNHAVHSQESFVPSWRRIVDAPKVGDRLYRNDGKRFTNVTHDAGIYSSTLGYGLGLAISDINQDGWPDIYVGNDFHENDYLYFNDGDGTFTEALQRVIGHTSQSSMGNDVADMNNDGRVDIISLDMLPPDLPTYRRSGGPDANDLAQIKRNFGYAPQYARNTLQVHRGFDQEGYPIFSEIGLHAGVHATDWSWASLLVDLDNDGWKDLYVTNGIARRPNDLDYVDFISQPAIQRVLDSGTLEEQRAVTERMPALSIPNYVFRNAGNDTFADSSAAWGLDTPGFSHGAAYGDLDNDGDMDLVVNNINGPAFLYRNNGTSEPEGNYVRIRLNGAGQNTTGVGAKVWLYADSRLFYQEQIPTRGFQSSVPHELHFGLGSIAMLDSVRVVWPDGQLQRLTDVSVNQHLVLRQDDADGRYERAPGAAGLFQDVTESIALDFMHWENDFQDYEAQPLIPHKLSTQGPALAVADVNGDGLEDFFIGGAHEQAGKLFVQQPGGTFASSDVPFAADQASEDVHAAFFDADGDSDLDLYVVSGGGQYPVADPILKDRLYINDGSERFIVSSGRLPDLFADGCCVAPADYDGDGDVDLFVGSRSVPGSYGRVPASYLLVNDGSGVFTDATGDKAPGLLDAGMVTDAIWTNVSGSDAVDLILTGEWMPITVLENSGDTLTEATEKLGLSTTNGWWNSLLADDFDDDGDNDLVAGNLGTNTVFKTSAEEPLELFVADFDNNGFPDPIMAHYLEGRRYTVARRDALLRQLPGLAQQLPTYARYGDAPLADLFSDEQLRRAVHKRAYTFTSSYFENRGAQGFAQHPLPEKAQWSPIMSLLAGDFDDDGHKDILTVSNFFGADTHQGQYDAGFGELLKGSGNGQFEIVPLQESMYIVRGDARDLALLGLGGDQRVILVARNNDAPLVFRLDAER